MGESILVQTFVVVVIGGVGSFPGAILGGLISGEILSLTSMVDPSLFGGHAVRGDDPGAAAAAAGPARRAGPRVSARRLMLRAPASAGRGADGARPGRRAVRAAACSASRPARSTRSWSGACSASASTFCSATPACLSFGQSAFYRHRRLHRRLSADQQSDVERAGWRCRSARSAPRWPACWSARSRCGAPASISR